MARLLTVAFVAMLMVHCDAGSSLNSKISPGKSKKDETMVSSVSHSDTTSAPVTTSSSTSQAGEATAASPMPTPPASAAETAGIKQHPAVETQDIASSAPAHATNMPEPQLSEKVADTPKPPAKDELQGAKPTLKSFEQDREAHHAVSSDADSKATEKLEQIAARKEVLNDIKQRSKERTNPQDGSLSQSLKERIDRLERSSGQVGDKVRGENPQLDYAAKAMQEARDRQAKSREAMNEKIAASKISREDMGSRGRHLDLQNQMKARAQEMRDSFGGRKPMKPDEL
mmetsp:Transcript_30792/g.59436  ORF Transcript_30792/g.59436 Transcript_30792/m.59436 type:complete len:286 (-) Transcript_30792:386-1243(-)|eukprot:CAMPEP_0114243822 /NCGR_PEP_ID=MMETSP0058-20121206/11000_1 /TAXON_ID=36894 /ORGANISM="Pyramimonas parkeae, CCMP726" /LENGTH=285 /DNA_ID=CAMNT_0001356699 /DNA_START=31 /DNA_END=888 /DNA_ORIENTATION=-